MDANNFLGGIEQEVGWDSEKAGYDGLIEVANRLVLRRTPSETTDAAVCLLLHLLFFYLSLIFLNRKTK